MFRESSDSEVKSLFSEMIKQGKLVYNNYFGIPEKERCEIEVASNTILVRKKEFDFYRLYILSRDPKETEMLLASLNDSDYVINIPSKGKIDDWDELLINSGFTFLDVYSRFYNNNIPSYPSSIETFASEEEVDDVAELLYSNFSKYTDHLPDRQEILDMVKNHQVITDYMDGKLCGVMIYTIIGNKGYQNFWINKKGENALSLLFKAKNILIEHGIKYCYYWIKDTNKPVIKIHTLLGGKPDGLKDYSYLKKKN